ncbi:Spc24 subunit of Ndc80-domain-containing protein [Biscogniauxia marginata]|nr:Spc24 subunit of Ndc80-domain-containing protein [Biscogniauxia marginata]
MILTSDPAALINYAVSNFNTAPDKNAISRIHDGILDLQEKRKSRVRAAESELKRLARQLNTQQTQYEELTSAHSSAAHASEISRLDTQKFRIAKAASDLEMETERLSSQQADLAARLQELELQGLDGSPDGAAGGRRDPVDDEVLLRLRVYRSLGIDLERDDRDGEFSKAVVRNDRKGDVHVVNLDKKFSRFFYANYFWQTL